MLGKVGAIGGGSNQSPANQGMQQAPGKQVAHPGSYWLACGNSDGTIQVFDHGTLERLRVIGHVCRGECLCEKRADGTVARIERCPVSGHTGMVRAVSWGLHGEVVSASWDGSCRIWDPHRGVERLTLLGHAGAVRSVQFSPDSKIVATGGEDKTVRLWTAEDGIEFCTLAGHAGTVWSVSWGPNGELASGASDNSIKLWDLSCSQEKKTLSTHIKAVFAVAWSHNGALASGSWDNTCKIWDPESGNEVHTLQGHSDKVTSVAWGKSGLLASGSMDKKVKVWDASTGTEVFTLDGHAALVRSVAFSPDGETLAVGGEDGTIQVWSVHDCELTGTLNTQAGVVFSVSFSPTAQHRSLSSGLSAAARKRTEDVQGDRGTGEASARGASESLDALRQLIQSVKRKRLQEGSSEEALRKAQGFQQLAEAIRASLDEHMPDDDGGKQRRLRWERAEEVAEAARAAMAGVREELWRRQSDVRTACRAVEVMEEGIEDEKKRKSEGSELERRMQQRDLVRAELCRTCRAQLQQIRSSLSLEKAGISEESEGVAAVLIRSLSDQMAALSTALNEARSSLTSISQSSSQNSRVGVDAEAAHGPREAILAFKKWVASCSGTAFATATDEALDRVSRDFMSLAPTRTVDSDSEAESILIAAGRALDQELAWLERDPLTVLPSRVLLGSGQAMLEAMGAELSALQRVEAVLSELSAEHALHEQALDSTGARVLAMRAWVEGVGARSERVRDARFALEDAQTEATRARQRKRSAEAIARIEESEAAKRRAFRDARAELQDAMTRVLEQEPDFPEVMRVVASAVEALMEGVGASLSPDLMRVLDPSMSLAAFDECELLSSLSNSRHAVYKARDRTAWFAVKEYAVSDSKDMARALREAGLLWRLRHPHIVELRAIFFDSRNDVPKLLLQMPLYSHGQLDCWVRSSAPPWWVVRQALTDVLGALAFIHALKVVHGDVKPANILIDARERSLLADFDVSIDAAARTHATVAFSRDFMAPEVPTLGASAASDVFALGKTAASEPVRAACHISNASATSGTSGVGDGYEEEKAGVDAFVRDLTAAEAGRRPRAEDAVRHAFCEAVERRERGEEEPRECCVRAGERCVELKVPFAAGLECNEGHFVCRECLEGVTRAAMSADLAVKRRHAGRIACPKHPLECKDGAFPDADLARVLPSELVGAYLGSRVALMEAARVERLEAEYARKVDEELQRLLALDERQRKVEQARKHVEEEVLQLKCPRCKQAFLDFDGCCALQCSRCGCGFCAWCLRDCGGDAHQHVGRCSAKPDAARADPFFASKALVDSAQRARRVERLRAHLASLDAETRELLVRDMKAMLDDRLPGWAA